MMGHKTKLITFPGEMTVTEFEKLLSDNGLIYEQTVYRNDRMERDIEKFKGKNVKVGYMPDKVVCTYSYNDGSVDEPDPE
jgi:hypothetical protein